MLRHGTQYDGFVRHLIEVEGPIKRDAMARRVRNQATRPLTLDHAGRLVRAAIPRLIKAGIPIVQAKAGGYMIATKPEQAYAEADRFSALGVAHMERAADLRKAAAKMQPGQRRFLFEGEPT